MKKKLITSLIIISALSISGCGAKITQIETTKTVELGSKFEINLADFFTTDKPEIFSDFLVDSTSVDTNTVGSYIVTVGYEKDRYNILVKVEDTTAPTITINELETYRSLAASELKEAETPVVEGDIFSNLDAHITYDREFYKDESGKTKANITWSVSEELRAEIFKLIPELENYPEEWREKQFQRVASKGYGDTAESIINNIQSVMDEYYKFGYDKEYGPVKGHEDTTQNNQNTQSNGNTSGLQSNNNSGLQNNNTTGSQNNNNSDTLIIPYVETYITEEELYSNREVVYADNPVVIRDDGFGVYTYVHTGEYIDGKAVYISEYGHKYHITTSGAYEMISETAEEISGGKAEGGANLSDHLRD